MADLPVERILPDLPPFTMVGVDYFGPIEIKRGRALIKRYGVVFTALHDLQGSTSGGCLLLGH